MCASCVLHSSGVRLLKINFVYVALCVLFIFVYLLFIE
jgi:hypothetical protein